MLDICFIQMWDEDNLYASDAMLLAANSNDLQQMLDRCHKEYENEN